MRHPNPKRKRGTGKDLASLARFDVAPFGSREATIAHSLGRKPKDSEEEEEGSREAAVAVRPASICCRRFAALETFARIPWAYAQGYVLSPLRGWKRSTSKNASEEVERT